MSGFSVNNKVLDIVKKIRTSLEENKLPIEDFPMESISSLLEDTVGASFWSAIRNVRKEGDYELPAAYMGLFNHLVKQNDAQGCAKLLELFELHYKSLYGIALDQHEEYKSSIKAAGNALSKLQYRLHKERQKDGEARAKLLPARRGVVYTCLFGAESHFMDPVYKNPFYDYVCFTDQKNKWGDKKGIWQFREMKKPDNWSDKLIEIFYLIHPHKIFPEYDFSIWVSNDLRIMGELEQWYEIYGENASFLGFPNYKNDNFYDINIMHMGNDDKNISNRVRMHRYHQEGYPEHNGLIDVRCIYRNHKDELLCQVMEDWWKEADGDVVYGEYSFNYIAWKNNFKFALCPLFIEKNEYVENLWLELGKE